MSRYYDDYDGDDYPNAGALWRANAVRALRGKRGRKALEDLREALLNLPEKRLISRALCTVNAEKRTRVEGASAWSDLPALIEEQGEGVCAVGAYTWWQMVKAGMDPAEAFDQLPTLDDSNHDIWETQQVGVSAGLTQHVAWELAYTNDETYDRKSPEERYTAFLGWIEQELARS